MVIDWLLIREIQQSLLYIYYSHNQSCVCGDDDHIKIYVGAFKGDEDLMALQMFLLESEVAVEIAGHMTGRVVSYILDSKDELCSPFIKFQREAKDGL